MAEKEEEPLNPFLPVWVLNPELDISMFYLWADMIRLFGVKPPHEMHGLDSACADEGCKRLIAFRTYIKEYSSFKAWERWTVRAMKQAKADLVREMKKGSKGDAKVIALVKRQMAEAHFNPNREV